MDIDYRFFIAMFFVAAEAHVFLLAMNQFTGWTQKLFVPFTVLGWLMNAVPPMVLYGPLGFLGAALSTLVGVKIYYSLYPGE